MTWFSSRLCSAAGWQRAPAVRGVRREHFHCTHHTHPSISSSNHRAPPPPLLHRHPAFSSLHVWFKRCLEDGSQQCERPISRLWQNHRNWVRWVFFFLFAPGEALKPASKGTETALFFFCRTKAACSRSLTEEGVSNPRWWREDLVLLQCWQCIVLYTGTVRAGIYCHSSDGGGMSDL